MHNLYIPWIRILFMLSIFSGMVYISQSFNPTPISIEWEEADFVEYKKSRELLDTQVQYKVNGENRNYGNLVALEPYLLPLDYYSEENFYNALKPVLEKAKSEKALDRKTLVVFPEHVGTGLVLLGEKKPAFLGKSMEKSKLFLLEYYREKFRSKKNSDIIADSDKQNNLKDSKSKNKSNNQDIILDSIDPENLKLKEIFRWKSAEMAKVYHNTFAKLAEEYKVSLLAGSILIADPDIKKGELVSQDGSIFNVSVTYLSTGKPISTLVKKVHLTDWEKELVTPGSIKQDFIIKVPAWTVGNLLGEDSLNEDIYLSIGGKKMDGIVSPASYFFIEDESESSLSSDKRTGDFWIKKGIGKWISKTKGKDHLQVFWKGDLGNIITGGETYTNRSAENIQKSGNQSGAKVLNLYF